MVLISTTKKVETREPQLVDFKALIEIESGSREKKVYDPISKSLKLHRILPSPLPSDIHYGLVPNTLSEDGAPVDIFVISGRNLVPCEEYDVIPLRMIRAKDDEGPDDKIIAVDKFDEKYKGLNHTDDRLSKICAELFDFVSSSKDNEPNKWVNVIGFEDVEAANDKILESYLRKQ
ncbi:MAG: inorganic diphosphatase [Candidatus Micrarchaeota archaeon]|nr:inorganic diphosphatase [Candidatus Micrarchaeota archaeon]